METALINELLASAGVTALTATRINWLRRPQGEALPAITLNVVGGSPDIHHGGASGLREARVQADCRARSYGAAKAVARSVEAALCARAFTRGAVRFDVILLADEQDTTEDGPSETIFRTRLDLMVHHANAS